MKSLSLSAEENVPHPMGVGMICESAELLVWRHGDKMDNLDIATRIAQIVIAAAVGYIAWLARRDARRNSIAGLLKLVTDQRKEASKQLADRMVTVLSPESDFWSRPARYREIILDQLDSIVDAKRGLDLAEASLLKQADDAWNLGVALQRQHSGMNKDVDQQWHEMRDELRVKHGQSSDA